MAQDEPRLLNINLTEDERTILRFGLLDWGGPASECSESLAIALGFAGRDDPYRESERIVHALDVGAPLSVRDWTRALFSAEVIYASDLVGTGSVDRHSR